MLDYQRNAIERVRKYANVKESEHRAYMERICDPFGIDVLALTSHVLRNSITINFHPDRISNNGKTVLENLLEQGQYHGQFRTGTTNGGRSAYIGGDRYQWEQRMFNNAYPQDSLDRPKYGALNLLRYIDGASARFGSCCLALKSEVAQRCTFAYGDSSTDPTILCTSDTFVGVLAGIFKEIKETSRILNQAISSEVDALAVLMNPHTEPKQIGRNLDFCIEAHVHGNILLEEDVECFYVDESFLYSQIGEQAEALCRKYRIKLKWIPERQVSLKSIGDVFRGPMIPVLADEVDRRFGNGQGNVNAALIGQASRSSLIHPETWEDIGTESELFQYLKQLWHTVAYFG